MSTELSMRNAYAYILKLSNKRQQYFDLFIPEHFTEAVDEFTYSPLRPLICFIVNPHGEITHICFGKRGTRAATHMRRLDVSDITKLSMRLPSGKIIVDVPSQVRHHVSKAFEDGGLLTPKSFEHVVDAVTSLSPELRSLIDRLSNDDGEHVAKLSGAKRTALAYQKESIATALFISDMDRSLLADWTTNKKLEHKSFLDGLPEARRREDSMIVNDMMNVPGYKFIKSIPNAPAAYFESDGKRLTVILASRLELEEQTGTDLIYYNETFKSFVMVQYKAMESDTNEGAIFRYPQDQLAKEIERMDTIRRKLRKSSIKCSSRDGFRFDTNPFFLKFCPRLQFDPSDTGLIKGMYLPLNYWKMTKDDPIMNGPKGGKRLTYSNIGRYLTNSDFAAMVSGAWVGTSVTQASLLEAWIKETIKHGRAVTFAVKNNYGHPSAQTRYRKFGITTMTKMDSLEGD